MLCIHCKEWFPDEEGSVCEACNRKKGPIQDAGFINDNINADPAKHLEKLWRRYIKVEKTGEKITHRIACTFDILGVCTCGLLYDLMDMPTYDAKASYPKFEEEVNRQIKSFEKLATEDGREA